MCVSVYENKIGLPSVSGSSISECTGNTNN